MEAVPARGSRVIGPRGPGDTGQFSFVETIDIILGLLLAWFVLWCAAKAYEMGKHP